VEPASSASDMPARFAAGHGSPRCARTVPAAPRPRRSGSAVPARWSVGRPS